VQVTRQSMSAAPQNAIRSTEMSDLVSAYEMIGTFSIDPVAACLYSSKCIAKN
jgi:hypothetical protein